MFFKLGKRTLKLDLFKNVFKGPGFFVTNGVSGTKQITKKVVFLIYYSLKPSDMNFEAISMPKVNLAKLNHSYL